MLQGEWKPKPEGGKTLEGAGAWVSHRLSTDSCGLVNLGAGPVANPAGGTGEF